MMTSVTVMSLLAFEALLCFLIVLVVLVGGGCSVDTWFVVPSLRR
jgi:hypothetical protein